MSFWRTLFQTVARNPISFFAVLCVACTAAFLGWLTYRLLIVLESPAWCAKAIQAEKVSPGSTYVGLTTCVELLKIQLEAVATGFHISTGGFVFVLIVLIVVVVAGARASGKVGQQGLEFDIGKHNAAEAGAEHVKEAAVDAANEVRAG
jgi:Na+-transporting methylmalonyl-CoA/oxaloacetate decarboxylase gamma subunit